LSGADDGGAEFAINAVGPNSATDCSQKWEFTGFGSSPGSATLAGSWSPAGFGTDVNGRHPLVVVGGGGGDLAVDRYLDCPVHGRRSGSVDGAGVGRQGAARLLGPDQRQAQRCSCDHGQAQ
jgi:hypothetical protein